MRRPRDRKAFHSLTPAHASAFCRYVKIVRSRFGIEATPTSSRRAACLPFTPRGPVFRVR
ncbi:hypothetical protein ACIQMZ_17735 [Streptomyces longwoodensis]|uniref:hypothetical protein n=1 Tax=Streptomyces longwoodensis TaxID=68231 RepID=UPI00380F5B30